jgi:hypothetical protein
MTKKLTITVFNESTKACIGASAGEKSVALSTNWRVGMSSRSRRFFRGSLVDAYRAMTADEQAAREAHEWTEGLIGETLADEDFSDWPGNPSR